MIRICSSLQAAGYEVMLVGRKRRQSLPLVERPFLQHRINCHFEAGKLFYLEFNLRLLKYLWQHPASIINSVDLDTLLPGYWSAAYVPRHSVFTTRTNILRKYPK